MATPVSSNFLGCGHGWGGGWQPLLQGDQTVCQSPLLPWTQPLRHCCHPPHLGLDHPPVSLLTWGAEGFFLCSLLFR